MKRQPEFRGETHATPVRETQDESLPVVEGKGERVKRGMADARMWATTAAARNGRAAGKARKEELKRVHQALRDEWEFENLFAVPLHAAQQKAEFAYADKERGDYSREKLNQLIQDAMDKGSINREVEQNLKQWLTGTLLRDVNAARDLTATAIRHEQEYCQQTGEVGSINMPEYIPALLRHDVPGDLLGKELALRRERDAYRRRKGEEEAEREHGRKDSQKGARTKTTTGRKRGRPRKTKE